MVMMAVSIVCQQWGINFNSFRQPFRASFISVRVLVMAMVTSEGDGSVKKARMFIKNVCRSDDRKVEKKKEKSTQI